MSDISMSLTSFRISLLMKRRKLQGHPPELSDSVKLLLSDAKRYGFEIDHVLKSID